MVIWGGGIFKMVEYGRDDLCESIFSILSCCLDCRSICIVEFNVV